MFCFDPLAFTAIAINDKITVFAHVEVCQHTHNSYHIQRMD